jgi:GNAT superfamily N-acetyltransferase
MPPITIRPLDPARDLALVERFYREAPDYWLFAEGRAPDAAKAREFFTDGPPGCDPARSHRLGLFAGDHLQGLAELSFGFPEPDDAYLGLMILAPGAQGYGHGARFLSHVETLARAAGSPNLYLAVIGANTRGRAFWEREGFRATGVTRHDTETGHTIHRLLKAL